MLDRESLAVGLDRWKEVGLQTLAEEIQELIMLAESVVELADDGAFGELFQVAPLSSQDGSSCYEECGCTICKLRQLFLI